MHRNAAIAAALLFAASPALAEDAPAADPQAVPPAACAPAAKKGPGVGGLLSAARRAGVGQILANQSLAGGKGSVAGAVLGTAISAADTGGSSAPGLGGLPFGFSGSGKAAAAAAATGTAIEVAKAAAAAPAPPCPQP